MLFTGQIDRYKFTYRLEGNYCHPALLFLHGFMGDRDDFDEIIAILSHQFYCITIDLPAHRDSQIISLENSELPTFAEPCSPIRSPQVSKQFLGQYHTMQATARFVINFLDLIHLKKCNIVGYSMGGRLALYIAVHFPNYVDRLILESASPGIADTQARRDRYLQDLHLANTLENMSPSQFREFLQQWYQKPIFGNLRSHPHFTQMLQRRQMQHPPALAQSLKNLSTGLQPSLWENLPHLTTPTLLIAGELDHKFVQINQQILPHTNLASLEIMPNCGHNTHFEQPAKFAQILQNWLLQQS
ncbi:MAG: alpha/beta fold hydrolase [Pseudanabaenaceae cyanobacterium bins.39]|nr:alpha/beta fold hydrolase [Pseudanabaenaceae cyanobacterium bins.39]